MALVAARRIAVTGLSAVVLAGPVLYPAGLAFAARRRPIEQRPPDPPDWPNMTVVVAAYHEARLIAAKVADAHANGYPGRLQVVVVADDEPTAAAARETAAVVVSPGRRVGKSAALDIGVTAADGEIVVLSDANTRLMPGSLAALAAWFCDPAVGAVAGEKQLSAGAESAYWRFESWLKTRESRLGGTIGLVGELAAIRRTAWRPVPADVAVDDLWVALDVLEQGLRVVYEPAAVAVEDASGTWQEDWERRTRIVAGMLDVVRRRQALLLRADLVSAQLWGHRVLRASAAPVAQATLLGFALVRLRRGPRSAPISASFAMAHVVAGAAHVLTSRGQGLPGPVGALGSAAFLQAVGLGGLWRHLRREPLARWPKVDRGGAA
ncbi:MAG: glycosyltransferase [Frankiaceae bacterium]|nr:glycosyltransferase [Frankiaceae bacterium]